MEITITPWGVIIAIHKEHQYFIKVVDPSVENTLAEVVRYGEPNFVRVEVNTKEFKKDEEQYIEKLCDHFEEVMVDHHKKNQNGSTILKPSKDSGHLRKV